MKKFENAEIEVKGFEAEDIICGSPEDETNPPLGPNEGDLDMG